MKVRDLIRELEAFDDEVEVHFSYSYGDHWRSVVAPKCNNVDLGAVIYSQYHSMSVVIDEEDTRFKEAREVVVISS